MGARKRLAAAKRKEAKKTQYYAELRLPLEKCVMSLI